MSIKNDVETSMKELWIVIWNNPKNNEIDPKYADGTWKEEYIQLEFAADGGAENSILASMLNDPFSYPNANITYEFRIVKPLAWNEIDFTFAL